MPGSWELIREKLLLFLRFSGSFVCPGLLFGKEEQK